jgi:hypothetical protein
MIRGEKIQAGMFFGCSAASYIIARRVPSHYFENIFIPK